MQTGHVTLQGRIKLEVRDRYHRFEAMPFIIDPGCGITTIPLSLARERHLAVPTKCILLAVRSVFGQRTVPVYPARITVRVPGLPGKDFLWPCHFLEGPETALLGLGGVLRDLNIHFEDAYSLQAPYGYVSLEEHP